MQPQYPPYLSPETLQIATQLDAIVPEFIRLSKREHSIQSRLEDIRTEYPHLEDAIESELGNSPDLTLLERVAWLGAMSVYSGPRITFRERYKTQQQILTRLEAVDRMYTLTDVPILAVRNRTKYTYEIFKIELVRTLGSGLLTAQEDEYKLYTPSLLFVPETERIFEAGDTGGAPIRTRHFNVNDLLMTFVKTQPELAAKIFLNTNEDADTFRFIGENAIKRLLKLAQEKSNNYPRDTRKVELLNEAYAAWKAYKANRITIDKTY